jgi:hypothetical protein
LCSSSSTSTVTKSAPCASRIPTILCENPHWGALLDPLMKVPLCSPSPDDLSAVLVGKSVEHGDQVSTASLGASVEHQPRCCFQQHSLVVPCLWILYIHSSMISRH